MKEEEKARAEMEARRRGLMDEQEAEEKYSRINRLKVRAAAGSMPGKRQSARELRQWPRPQWVAVLHGSSGVDGWRVRARERLLASSHRSCARSQHCRTLLGCCMLLSSMPSFAA